MKPRKAPFIQGLGFTVASAQSTLAKKEAAMAAAAAALAAEKEEYSEHAEVGGKTSHIPPKP